MSHKSCSRGQLETLASVVKPLEKYAQERSWRSQELLPRRARDDHNVSGTIGKISSGAQLEVTRVAPERSSRRSQCQWNHWKNKPRSVVGSHKSCSREQFEIETIGKGSSGAQLDVTRAAPERSSRRLQDLS